MDEAKSSKFSSTLSEFLHLLCRKYVDFKKTAHITGQLLLSIDRGEEIEFVIYEEVHLSGNSYLFTTNEVSSENRSQSKEFSDVKI